MAISTKQYEVVIKFRVVVDCDDYNSKRVTATLEQCAEQAAEPGIGAGISAGWSSEFVQARAYPVVDVALRRGQE